MFDGVDEILTVLGDAVQLYDEQAVEGWLTANFPFPPPGSTCEWTQVPGARTIPISYTDTEQAGKVFRVLLEQVGAQDSDEVIVLWHSTFRPALRMPLWACKRVFSLLLRVRGEEMHLVSMQAGWYLEVDPFFDEAHGGRVARTTH